MYLCSGKEVKYVIPLQNILRLQGDEESVKTAMGAIPKPNRYINFGRISSVPPWAKNREHTLQIWRMKNWGVTESAKPADDHEPYYAPNLLVFYTLGSCVRDLMQKISLMFPSLTLDYMWASENIGQDAGMMKCKGESGRDIREWIDLMKRNMAVEEIDRGLLMRPIDKIVVGQKREENGLDYQGITIFRNLVGAVE